MIALLFAIVGLGLVGLAISVDLKRIANAVEAQNRHYGVPVDTPAGKEAA